MIHVSEVDAARHFAALLARAQAGAEIIIDGGSQPAAVLTVAPVRRSIEECIALLPENSKATIDRNVAG